jgi:hypothetical protein
MSFTDPNSSRILDATTGVQDLLLKELAIALHEREQCVGRGPTVLPVYGPRIGQKDAMDDAYGNKGFVQEMRRAISNPISAVKLIYPRDGHVGDPGGPAFYKSNWTHYTTEASVLQAAGYPSGAWLPLDRVADMGPVIKQLQDVFGVLKKYVPYYTVSAIQPGLAPGEGWTRHAETLYGDPGYPLSQEQLWTNCLADTPYGETALNAVEWDSTHQFYTTVRGPHTRIFDFTNLLGVFEGVRIYVSQIAGSSNLLVDAVFSDNKSNVWTCPAGVTTNILGQWFAVNPGPWTTGVFDLWIRSLGDVSPRPISVGPPVKYGGAYWKKAANDVKFRCDITSGLTYG